MLTCEISQLWQKEVEKESESETSHRNSHSNRIDKVVHQLEEQDSQDNHDGEQDIHLLHRLRDVQTNIGKVGEGLLRHMAVVVTNPQLVHTILLISKPIDTFA